MRLQRNDWLQIVLIVLATALVYVPHLGNAFVMLDDGLLIYRNPFVQQMTPWSLKMIFTTYDPELYVPLTLLSYQLEIFLFGLKPFIFHATNLLLHAGSSILVYVIVLACTKGHRIAAFVGALLFAIHPLNTEAVLWASARKDVLSGLFFLASLAFYQNYHNTEHRRSLRWSLAAFALALLAKVSVIMLPIVLLLLDWFEGRSIDHKNIREKIPYFALSVLFSIIAIIGKTQNIASSDTLTTFLLAEKSTVFYLKKLLIPFDLSVIYPQQESVAFFSSEFLIYTAICIALLLLFFWSLRRSPMLALGLGFFGLMLLPNYTNFLKNGYLFFASDRYAYLASVGLFFLAGCAVQWMMERMRGSPRLMRAGTGILGVYIAILAGTSFAHGKTWRDSEVLYRNVLAYYPDAAIALNNLGDVLMKEGRTAEAKGYFEQAIARDPRMLQAHLGLGNARKAEGNFDRAMEHYTTFIAIAEEKKKMGPEDLVGYYFLGELLEQMGRNEESIAQFIRATAHGPNFAEAFFNLGLQYQKRGRTAGARTAFEQAVAVDPLYSRAHYHLAGIYGEEGRLTEAKKELETVLRLDPGNAKAREHLERLKTLLKN